MEGKTVFIFPFLANLIFFGLILRQLMVGAFKVKTSGEIVKQVTAKGVFLNLIGSLSFGASIAIQVATGPVESGWWPMPLVIAPIEYWFVFGLPVIGLCLLMSACIVWFKQNGK